MRRIRVLQIRISKPLSCPQLRTRHIGYEAYHLNTRQGVEELLQTVLELDGTRVAVQVKSMAISPDGKTKVATVNFKNLPALFSSHRNEWPSDIPNVDCSNSKKFIHSEPVKLSSNDENYERVLSPLKRMKSGALLAIPHHPQTGLPGELPTRIS
jgi:hypothetical protein